MSRFFIVQSNIMTYIIPNDPSISVCFFSTQFLSPGVNDTFVQDCSFSTRAFGSSFPDFNCCTFYNHGKVSILDSQFNGSLICQSDKLALFGCYMLGVGILSSEVNTEPNTTPALFFTPPTGKAPELAGYPQKDARFIQSGCEWVCYINNWSQDNKNDISGTIYNNSIDTINNTFNKEQFILPWRLYTDDNNWNNYPLTLYFSNANFYMVDPSNSSGFHFNCINLTNINNFKLNFNDPWTAFLSARKKQI